ncbi:Hypothetical_protein [Hexamita inflata]|uniref:Hypothetical_protein n=1 Tax=Hexamita inflata TaxID=28002 RepID=A0ABP1HQ17_9EUKA
MLEKRPHIQPSMEISIQFCGLLLFALPLLLFLLGRQGCLFQNIFNVLDFLQTFNFQQEYLTFGSVDELTFIKRLQDQYQVGLNLTYQRFLGGLQRKCQQLLPDHSILTPNAFSISIFSMAFQLVCLCIELDSYIALLVCLDFTSGICD